MLNMVLVSLLNFVCCLLGLIAFSFYHTCDPLRNGEISNADQVQLECLLLSKVMYSTYPHIYI